MNRASLYMPGRSVMHALDPRAKMAGVALVFTLVLVFNDPRYLALVLALTLLAALLSGAAARVLLQFLAVLGPVTLLTVGSWPFFVHSGRVVARLGGIAVTDQGLLFALAMGERVLTPVLAALLLFVTSRRRDIVAVLVRIGLPYHAGFGITIAFGFVPILIGTGHTIREAQQARGLQIRRGSILHRLRISASLIVPLVIRAVSSVRDLAFSMEARAYGARPRRTELHTLRLSAADRVILIVAPVVLAVAIALRVTGHGAILPHRL